MLRAYEPGKFRSKRRRLQRRVKENSISSVLRSKSKKKTRKVDNQMDKVVREREELSRGANNEEHNKQDTATV